jgi:predicted transcriptional regulator
LKLLNGKLSPEQKVWREKLINAGAEYYLWKPSDWEEIKKVLA